MRWLLLAVLTIASVHGFAPALGMQPGAAIHRGGPVFMGGAKDGIFSPLVKLTKRIVVSEGDATLK